MPMQLLKPIAATHAASLQATAIIVLYGMMPEQSPVLRSLLEARAAATAREIDLSIVVWDNSPSPPEKPQLPEGIDYFRDPRNPGLAFAYNQALGMAIRRGSHWLITLDQDSTVPRDYLNRMAAAAHLCLRRPDVGAIVPQIAIGRKRLSPYRFALGAIPRWYRPGIRGIPGGPVFAFNSGAMLRVDALRQVGGYDLRFPIEYSDTAMFRKLHSHGKRVYIEGSVQLQHEFSLIEMNRRLSEERYRRTLRAETALWDLSMNGLAGCERTARLALRLVRHWVRSDRRELRRVTREFIWMRLFRSRRTRLHEWRVWLAEEGMPQADAAARPRPKVSVCMAAFNGARYIQAQIESILPQLALDDEMVIVDDGSQDETMARVVVLGDARIRLLAHESNQGVVATFEDALRCATGEILFLCDDDDLWHPQKVQRVLHEFERNDNVNVVTSRVALVNESDARLPDTRVNRYGRFLPGFWRNILVNHYQGSAMAIRASLLGDVLPFPRRKLFLHDAWIGTRNEALGGKTVYIDEPLIYYRRHAQNASRKHSLARQIRVRLELLLAHAAYAVKAGQVRNSAA